MADFTKPPLEVYRPPLNESLYNMDDEDLTFLKAQSGIQDPDALKKQIIAVQTKAYDLYSHACVRRFSFTRPKISTFPVYQHVLDLGRKGGIVLDLGCCFGTDIRKCWSDGIPAENLIASDLRPVFWNLGHELFQTIPETFPIAFLAGDALNSDFLESSTPLTSPSDVSGSAPALSSLTTLTPLRGYLSAIHISSVFHLFFEPQQAQLARALAGLLSPAPGSVIFGSHGGRRTKGFNEKGYCSGGHHMFCHSPESWQEMWEEVFPKGTIKVEAELKQRKGRDEGADTGSLVWSVMRV
ncbi:Methyltransferase ausD [Mycena venus]|uniref:Methyltransferase ausD n=1 Tax=Mycena venus TaxID=2733690 RepID=A0A8H6Z1P8_9AGAR|nr:Methyltransferase ausD [Mycena venus]